MKTYYNQRFVYTYVDFSMCPCAKIELQNNYTKSQIDELVLEEVKKFSEENEVPFEDHWFYYDYFITVEE